MWNGTRCLVGVLAAVLSTSACGDSSTFGVGDGEAPDSVVVAPQTAFLDGPGQTRTFTATAYEGDEPVARDVTWTSTDFAVATISPDGVAVAQGTGETFIVATVEEVADSASLVVDFAGNPGS